MIKKYSILCTMLIFILSLSSCGIKGSLESMSEKESNKDFILNDLI